MFPSNHNHYGSILISDTYQDQNDNNSHSNQGNMLYHSLSLAETTTAKHDNQNSANIHNLPTRIGRDGRMYLFDPEDSDYTSIFEIGFLGCLMRSGWTPSERGLLFS